MSHGERIVGGNQPLRSPFMPTRYDVSGPEGEFEPGSRRRVLRNLLAIRAVRDMEQVESHLLLAATRRAIAEVRDDQRFTAEDIRIWHRSWLGTVYPWAGEYRGVNISKAGFPFAAASQVPRLMAAFEAGPMSLYTPCAPSSVEAVSTALAAVHVELVLIHPFRDGNGRCARLVATLMAVQAGLPPLDFSGVQGKERQRYFDAVHAAMARDLSPMAAIFGRIITKTLGKRES